MTGGLTRTEMFAPQLYKALKQVKDAFNDDARLEEWVSMSSNQEGSKLGFFLTPAQIRMMLSALRNAEGKS